MSEWKLYHNPRCSKSRATLDLLAKNGVEPEIIDYLNNPPSESDLQSLEISLGKPLKDFVRKKESAYQGLDSASNEELMSSVIENPILLERPIVVFKNQAVIGRPPENILELL